MMKMKSTIRLGALLLVICLITTLFPMGALAESTLNCKTYFKQWNDSGVSATVNQGSLDRMGLPLYGESQVVFYLGEELIVPDSVTVEDPALVTVERDPDLPETYQGYYLVKAGNQEGNTTLFIKKGSETYSYHVSVALPENGFSSSETLSRDTYLDSFTYTENARIFYYVCSNPIQGNSISVTLNGEAVSSFGDGLLSYSLTNGREVIQFEVSSSADTDMFLQLEFQPEGESGGMWYDGISLTNGKSRMETASLYFDNDGSVSLNNPEEWWPMDFSNLSLGTNQMVVLRYGSEETGFSYVTDLRSLNSDVLKVSERGTVAVGNISVPVFELECIQAGTTTLTCAAGNETGDEVEIPATISLPKWGAYTSQERSESTFVRQANYYELANKELWFLAEGGFTEEEKNGLQVMVDENTSVEESGGSVSWISRSTDPQTYDLKVTLPPANENLNWLNLNLVRENQNTLAWASVDYTPQTGGTYVEVGGKQYLVGIALDPDGSGAFEINESNSSMGNSTQGTADPANQRRLFQKIQVVAGKKQEDEQGNFWYEQVISSVVKLQVVNMTLEHLWGDEETFSWAKTGNRTAQISSGFSDNGTSAPLYFKEGYVGAALVKVTVKITAGGQTTTETVSIQVHTSKYEPTVIDCEDCDTVEQVNRCLSQEWSKVNSQDQVELRLKQGHTYEGTIELPAAQNGTDATGFTIQGNYAVLKGGIDLNGNTIGGIYAIHFLGKDVETSAVFGGSTSVLSSTFQDYALALDGSQGTVNPLNSVFVHNTVAAKVDIAAVTNGISENNWQNNFFLENQTAVQVVSLNSVLSSYYFRVYNSNFIDNATDFNVSCGGTLYFYKNYFGRKVTGKGASEDPGTYLNQLNGAIQDTPSLLKNLITSIAPKVEKDNKTKVITNPRWKEPVWYGVPSLPETVGTTTAQIFAAPMALNETESASTNYLTADWDLPTQIVNVDAADLALSGAAFGDDTTEVKVIRVDDDQGQEMGSWTFQKSKTGLGDFFNAGLNIRQEGEKITVKVQGGDVVETLQPTLTIPCDFTAKVTRDGTTLAASNVQGAVTFPVAAGGTYVIEKASSAQTPSGGGSAQPSKPVTSDGRTTVTTQVTPSISGGTAKAQVSSDVMDAAVEQVLQAAQKAGTSPVVEVRVNTGSASGLEMTLPVKSLKQLGESEKASLTVAYGAASVTLDSKALTHVTGKSSGSVTLEVAAVDRKDLNSQQQAAVEEAPIFELSLSGNAGAIPDLGKGSAVVSLHYQLSEGRKAQRVVVWKLDGKGTVTPCETSYDAESHTVSFVATCFSKYAIAYEPFADVKGNAWYFKAVDYMYDHQIMAGTSQTKDTFEPEAQLTRAQAVQILYNLDGKPEVTNQASFTDLPHDWSTNAISWAAENQVAVGFEDHSFQPEKNVTREEFAQMLYNYAAYKGMALSGGKDLSGFSDSESVSSWAEAAMSWANGNQLINGHDDGRIDGAGTAIRAQAASILMNFDLRFVKE